MTRPLFTAAEINTRLDQIASKVAAEYQDRPLILVGVLTGAFMVLADFARALWKAGKHDLTIDFIKTSSYIEETPDSRKSPKIGLDLSVNVQGKDVLIVEDIADTGHTLYLLQKHLKVENPRSLKTFALLNKPSKREVEVQLDYIGFEVDGWIEGYGLDSIRACPDVTVHE